MYTPNHGSNQQAQHLPEWVVEGARVRIITVTKSEGRTVSTPLSIYKITARVVELSNGDSWPRRLIHSDNTFHNSKGDGRMEMLVAEDSWHVQNTLHNNGKLL